MTLSDYGEIRQGLFVFSGLNKKDRPLNEIGLHLCSAMHVVFDGCPPIQDKDCHSLSSGRLRAPSHAGRACQLPLWQRRIWTGAVPLSYLNLFLEEMQTYRPSGESG